MAEAVEAVEITQGFISYTRDDNSQFGNVVDRLKSELAGWYEARTGKQISFFVDRDSIGWGEDWREKIFESVQSATIFVPIVTMRYFNSQACREELLAFYNSANRLGVTELILPIILSGAHLIRPDSDREEMQIVERLNYKNIEPAWQAGYDSPQWRTIVAGMVSSIDLALTESELRLSQRSSTSVALHEVAPGESSEEPTAEVEVDLLGMRAEMSTLTAEAQDVSHALTVFADAAGESLQGIDLSSLSAQQQQVALLRVAQQVKAPAAEFAEAASDFEQRVSLFDVNLRATVSELSSIDSPQTRMMLKEWEAGLGTFSSMATVLDQIQSLEQTLRVASLLNVNVRKALRPALNGIRATSNAVRTAQSWTELVDSVAK